MELQLANRVDYYSDFKWTTNPKMALRIQPHSKLLFRGSVGRAFVAPSLSSFAKSDSEGYPSIFDTVACYNELKAKGDFDSIYNELDNMSDKEKDTFVKDFLIEQRSVYNRKNLSKGLKEKLKTLSAGFPKKDYCKKRQVFTKGTGNKNLKETTAWVSSIGSLWQITEEHSLNFDLWYIKQNGVVSDGVSNDSTNKKTMDAELKFGNQHVKDNGVTINRDENHKYKAMYNGPQHGLDTKLLNLGKTQKLGLDIRWESDMNNLRLFGGNPYFQDQISYIFFSKVEAFPGMNTDIIGKFGNPRLRNIATVGWQNRKHNISLTAHTVSAFAKHSSELQDLPTYTRFDLKYQWLVNEKMALKFGWFNLFFNSPPTDDEADNNKLAHSIFESRGPFLLLGLKYSI